MEMRHHSDCGLDICNVTKKTHPPTHPNNTRKRKKTLRDGLHLKLDHTHETYTHELEENTEGLQTENTTNTSSCSKDERSEIR